MKIYIYCGKFQKESIEIQKSLINSMVELNKRIQTYKKQNTDFSQIFNDDKIKYDKHGDFFTYKCQKLNFQLRILYTYFEYENESVFIIVDYIKKKKNNKKYIKIFERYKYFNTDEVFKKSRLIFEYKDDKFFLR